MYMWEKQDILICQNLNGLCLNGVNEHCKLHSKLTVNNLIFIIWEGLQGKFILM